MCPKIGIKKYVEQNLTESGQGYECGRAHWRAMSKYVDDAAEASGSEADHENDHSSDCDNDEGDISDLIDDEDHSSAQDDGEMHVFQEDSESEHEARAFVENLKKRVRSFRSASAQVDENSAHLHEHDFQVSSAQQACTASVPLAASDGNLGLADDLEATDKTTMPESATYLCDR